MPRRQRPLPQCCKNCSLWDIASARSPSGRLRPEIAVLCLWQSTEVYPQHLSAFAHRPTGGFCSADGGTRCPCYKERP